MIMISKSFAVLLTLLCASVAAAQQPPAPVAVPIAAPAFWELISGYEGDTHGSGYGFVGPSYVRPIRPGLAWTARGSGNFLSYQFSGHDGSTRVRSPGVNAAIGLQFGGTSFFRVLAGPEVKWQRTAVTDTDGVIATSRRTRVGANMGAEMYANPTSHSTLQGLVNYNSSDRYSWGRLGFKEQISNRTWERPTAAFVGIEGIVQGNHDIRSRQVGGFFELTHVPAKVSIMLKAGYKRSTFDVGPYKSGPYFSVGFYRRMN